MYTVKSKSVSSFVPHSLQITSALYSLPYPKILVEASPYDKIWGIGLTEDDEKAQDESTWEGENLLGNVLTALREDLLLVYNSK